MKPLKLSSKFGTTNKSGVALVITLLVIVILTIAVTAFMQSMSLERRTSQAYLNILKADEVSEAGLQAALQQLCSYDPGTGTRIPLADFHYVVSKTSPANALRTATAIVALQPNTADVLSTTELASRGTGTPKTYKFVNNTDTHEVDLVPITDLTGKILGNYSYFADSATSKQSVVEPAKTTRAFVLDQTELPLIKTDFAALGSSEIAGIMGFITSNPSWKSSLLTPISLNQFTSITPPLDNWNVELETWTSALNQVNKPKVDLRQLKFYLDNPKLSFSQAPGNPRSKVVEALLNKANVELQAQWGGGDLSWLIDNNNPKKYTLVEGRQIVANLMDYIDADIFPTADSDTAPTYMGVEAHYATVNGVLTNKVQGHPYINAVATGLVFNRSSSAARAGGLNSTRVLCTLGVVNPWEVETLPWVGSYSVEIETTITGDVTGGTLGSAAQPYFSQATYQKLTDSLTAYPTQATGGKIQPYSGYAFPQPNSGSAGYSTPFYTLNPQQPGKMTFKDINIAIKTLRVKYTSGSDFAYVQILNNLPNNLVSMVPNPINLGVTGGSLIVKYSNGGPDKTDLHLKGDPRLNFQASDWYASKSTESGVLPPKPVTEPNVFSGMSATDGDGTQGALTNQNWYSNSNISRHLFVRSTEAFAEGYDPKNTPYDPTKKTINQLAVASTAELGYLFTGRPWETLRMYQTATAPTTREDWTLLDSVSTGTFPLRDQTYLQPDLKSVSGFINPVTARESAIRALFTGIPMLTNSTDVDALVDAVKTIPAANLPFTSSGDLFKDSRVVWPSVTTDFAKEELARRMANVLTNSSQIFTVHTYGETLSNTGKVIARSRQRTTVELVPSGGRLIPKILQRVNDPL